MLMSAAKPRQLSGFGSFPGEMTEVNADPLRCTSLWTPSLAVSVRAGVEVCLDSDCGN